MQLGGYTRETLNRFRSCALGLLAVSAIGVACTTTSSRGTPLQVRDDRDSGKGPSIDTTDDDGADPFLPDGGKPPGRVYANTGKALYLFDPLANKLSYVGDFGCVPQDGIGELGQSDTNDAVLDIAIDREGQMYGTTYWRFIKISPTDASCTVLNVEETNNLYPNSLSFVPIGTADPTQEVLVGYGYQNGYATRYTKIDLATGARSLLGNMNTPQLDGGARYGLSGDFISVDRGQPKTYGAVTRIVDGGASTATDLLAELDPATGAVKRIIGDMKQKDFYGLGFWAGTAYGLSATGGIYAVDMKTAKAELILQTKNDAGPIVWFGGGVTTDTPTAP